MSETWLSLVRARCYFSPPQLLTIYKSQIQPHLKYCFHILKSAPKPSLHLLGKFQSIAIPLISNSNLTSSLQSLSYRCLVAGFSIFYGYFHGNCSLEIKKITPGPMRSFKITRSSTQSHPFQVTLPNPRTLAHKSPFIPRTSHLWNTLPPIAFPEAYNLSSCKSHLYIYLNFLPFLSLFFVGALL